MSAAVDDATSPSPPPDVTVVVTAGSDPTALAATVGSVLDQTLASLECLVVGGHDTVVAGLAAVTARASRRARVVTVPDAHRGHLRNAGIDAARSRWVLVVDEGDVLERHAAKNLLLAAEATGAAIVCGPVEKGKGWDERRTVDSILDAPDLLVDAATANTLFSRAFLDEAGLRFAADVPADDVVLVTSALCAAPRITVVPTPVCRLAHRDSVDITDSIAAQRRVDGYLDARDRSDRRPAKDRVWLTHDFRTSLAALGTCTADERRAWLDVVGPYVRALPQESLAQSGELAQAAAWLVAHDDVDGAVAVADLWVRGSLAPGLVGTAGERVRIRSSADPQQQAAALDVTSLGLHAAPFSRQRLTSRLHSMGLDATEAVFDGVVTNLLERMTEEAPPTVQLVARSRDGRVQSAIGAATVVVEPDLVRWRVAAPTRALALDESVGLWDLWTRLELDGHVNLARVTAVPGAVGFRAVPLSPARPWTAPRLRLHTDAEWHVVARREQGTRAASVATRAGRRLRRSVVGRGVRRLRATAGGRSVKALVYRQVFSRLPARADSVVFESMLGRSYSDSPRYVYEELERQRRPVRAVWSFTGDREAWPRDSVVVRRDSWRYYYELGRAATWVDNQGFPAAARPRAGTRYLQTWHGSPLKAMGYDQPELQLAGERRRRQFAELVDRWTHFCVQSPFAEDAFMRAFRHRAENLRIGYPRNDPLLSPTRDSAAAEIRRRLDLPDDRRLVLYAPTFRDYRRTLRVPYTLPFDLGRVSDAVGDRCFLLIRPHYLDSLVVPPRFADVARDVSTHHDMTELLLVSDALVTDYSSTMFDYALLRRPMLFFAYDLDLYTMSRGTYFDLESDAPGPVVSTEAELVSWLANPERAHADHVERHARFLDRFCTFETGHAAADAVHSVFGKPVVGEPR